MTALRREGRREAGRARWAAAGRCDGEETAVSIAAALGGSAAAKLLDDEDDTHTAMFMLPPAAVNPACTRMDGAL